MDTAVPVRGLHVDEVRDTDVVNGVEFLFLAFWPLVFPFLFLLLSPQGYVVFASLVTEPPSLIPHSFLTCHCSCMSHIYPSLRSGNISPKIFNSYAWLSESPVNAYIFSTLALNFQLPFTSLSLNMCSLFKMAHHKTMGKPCHLCNCNSTATTTYHLVHKRDRAIL